MAVWEGAAAPDVGVPSSTSLLEIFAHLDSSNQVFAIDVSQSRHLKSLRPLPQVITAASILPASSSKLPVARVVFGALLLSLPLEPTPTQFVK